MDTRTLEVHAVSSADWPLSQLLAGIQEAIDLASGQDQPTVLVENGKPIAAVVPYEVLEYYRIRTTGIVSGPHAGHPHPGDSPCIAKDDVVTIINSETGKGAVRAVAHVERNIILLRDLGGALAGGAGGA